MSAYSIKRELPCPSLKLGMQSCDDDNESVPLRPDVINYYEHHSLEHRSLPDVCANSGVYPSVKLKHNSHQSNAPKTTTDSDVNSQDLRLRRPSGDLQHLPCTSPSKDLRIVNMVSNSNHITINDDNDIDPYYDNTIYIVAPDL